MFICGNDQEAKLMTKDLLKAFGWGTKDIGTIGLSSALEAMCVAWLGYGATSNTWTHAFKLLTK
jgi:predicted dinucleotide-binding enzyme